MNHELPARAFVWRCHDGRQMTPAEMETTHLFYTIRMIFNHLAPPAFRIPGCKRWGGIAAMDRQYLAQGLKAIAFELQHRDAVEPLPAWMVAQLRQINEACGLLLRSALN